MPNYTYTDDPNSAVKNKLGIRTHDELERQEAEFVAASDVLIAAGHGPAGQFDAAHLKAFHRHLFHRIYEWAGRTRDERVALSDGTVATEPLMRKADGKPFMAGPHIPQALDRIAATLREANYFRNLKREEFAERAADIMLDINAAHPFREGNGRTQRVFMQELAKQAGHTLDFKVVSRERMGEASIAGNERGDNTMMQRLFIEISDPVRVATLRRAIKGLDEHKFPWNDTYIGTAEPGHKLEVVMAGVAGEQFMARTGTAILFGQTRDLPEPVPERGAAFTLDPTMWHAESTQEMAAPEIPEAGPTQEAIQDSEREHAATDTGHDYDDDLDMGMER